MGLGSRVGGWDLHIHGRDYLGLDRFAQVPLLLLLPFFRCVALIESGRRGILPTSRDMHMDRAANNTIYSLPLPSCVLLIQTS